MNIRFRRLAAVLPLLAASAIAQYNVFPPTGPFLPIANAPGAVMLATVSACDDCTEPLGLTFPFPWFGANLTSLTVTSNGAILMGSFTDTLCCSNWALDNGTAGGTPAYFTPRPWIAVAQEDLNPGTAGDVWRLDTGFSTIVSWENVAFFGTTGASLNAQAELFITGDIEIRFGTSNTGGNSISTGLTNPLTPPVWFSPQSVLPAYNQYGQVVSASVPQNAGVRFTPGPGGWETNSPTSSLTLNGIQGTAYSKARTGTCTASLVAATSLGTPGQGWEVGFNFAPTVSASTPGSLVTGGGQILNIDLTQGIFFLFGGVTPLLVPHPGVLNVSFGAPPGTFSLEQIVLDPTNPEGFSLSQACQLDDLGGLVMPSLPFAGPTFDDSEVVVPLNCVRLFGRTFTQMFIESNGRLIFGNLGSTTFTPSATQFATDGASFGVWTDLNPSVGGSITLNSPGPGILNVAYVNVPYYAATTVLNNFQLQLDTNTGIASIIGLSGLGVGPGQLLVGISGGNAVGATNPGAANFSPGGAGTTGTTTNGTDMIYAIGTQGSVWTGINRIDFIPNPSFNYDWISQ